MPQYYTNLGTGQMYAVQNGKATLVSSIPAGQPSTSFANGYMPAVLSQALQTTGASPASTQTAPIVTTPYATPTQGASTPSIPASMYQQVRTQMANGSLSPQAAQQQLQQLLTSGQYSGSVDLGQLYAPMTITQGGAQYNLTSTGSLQPANATISTQTSTPGGVTNTSQAGNANGSTPSTLPSTGNANLDAAQAALASSVNTLAANGAIPASLQITPAVIQQFMAWAHDAVDPQTQQLLQNEAAGINNALAQATTDYQNTQGEAIQQYGMGLASQDNALGNSGFSNGGYRTLADTNLTNSTNRTLSTNAANANYNISDLLQTGASALGSSNAGQLNTPTLSAPTVSSTGGSYGSSNSGNGINFNYNPNAYAVGSIPTSQNTAFNNLVGNYETQYSTLAGNNSNSGQTFSSLYPLMTGLPAGATSNLQ